MKTGKWRNYSGIVGEVVQKFDDKKPFLTPFLARTITKRREQTSFVIGFDIECKKKFGPYRETAFFEKVTLPMHVPELNLPECK